MDESDEPVDADHESRKDALRFLTRRSAIWVIPLTLVGVLLVGLGIPWWISVGAMIIMLIVVVFEIDM